MSARRLLECSDVLGHVMSWLPCGESTRSAVLAHSAFQTTFIEVEPTTENLDTVIEHRIRCFESCCRDDFTSLSEMIDKCSVLNHQLSRDAHDCIQPSAPELERLKEELEGRLGPAYGPLADARDALLKLRKDDITIVMAIPKPPHMFTVLGAAVVLILGSKTRGNVRNDYDQFRMLVHDRQFIQSITELEPRDFAKNARNVQRLSKLLDDPELDVYKLDQFLKLAGCLMRLVKAFYDATMVCRECEPMFALMNRLMEPAQKIEQQITRVQKIKERLNAAPSVAQTAARRDLELGFQKAVAAVTDAWEREMLGLSQRAAVIHSQALEDRTRLEEAAQEHEARVALQREIDKYNKLVTSHIRALPPRVRSQPNHWRSQQREVWNLPKSVHESPRKMPAGHAALLLRAQQKQKV